MKDIKVLAVQMEVVAGCPDINVRKILKEIASAKKRKADMVIFPEMAVGGYLLGDEWENESFVRDLMRYNEEILAASKGITVIWGNVYVEFSKHGDDGRVKKFNAAYVAGDGEWLSNGMFEGHTYKTLMPKYREFDDERHFYSLLKLAQEENKRIEDLLKPFPIKIGDETVKVGVILCEDMWCENYAFNPTKILAENGAELIINISCSPWTWRKNDKRHEVVRRLLEVNPLPFIYCNNVGIQNNGKNIFLFDGGTTVYNADGSIGGAIASYKDEVLEVEINSKVGKLTPRFSVDRDTKELYDGLIYGIRKFFEKLPSERVVIGLSGGIDSAVSVCLLVAALGRGNVFGINMPSKFNSKLTQDSAKELANNLGVNFRVWPIQKSVNLTVKEMKMAELKVNDWVLENIQARDRSSRVLAVTAASLGAVFVSNANKTEMALGYTTLYGDLDGALVILGDLYKWEIYKLAEYINKINRKKIISESILKVTPSAELSWNHDVTKGKGDPIVYPYHDKLVRAFVEFRKGPEDILEMYGNGSLEKELKIKIGLIKGIFPTVDDFIDDLERSWKLFKMNYFKRIQSPPVIAVSRRAFGYDLRESQNGVYWTRGYIQLKKQLLG